MTLAFRSTSRDGIRLKVNGWIARNRSGAVPDWTRGAWTLRSRGFPWEYRSERIIAGRRRNEVRSSAPCWSRSVGGLRVYSADLLSQEEAWTVAEEEEVMWRIRYYFYLWLHDIKQSLADHVTVYRMDRQLRRSGFREVSPGRWEKP